MTEPRSTGPDGDSLGDEHPGLRPPDPAADALPSTDGSDAPESPGRPEPTAPGGGPPAAGVFSLERPASGLYLVAWLLTGIGLATLIIAVISTAGARSQLAMAGLLSMSVGLAAACGSQVVERRVSRPEAAYRGPSPVLGFFTAAVLSGSAAVVLGIAGLLDPAAGSGFLLGLLVVAAGYFAVVVFFVVRTGALTWVQMGWPTAPGRASAGW